mgnify:FL=1
MFCVEGEGWSSQVPSPFIYYLVSLLFMFYFSIVFGKKSTNTAKEKDTLLSNGLTKVSYLNHQNSDYKMLIS